MSHPKFVQIAASATKRGDSIEENLYALDEDGVVWWYDFARTEWSALPGRRTALPDRRDPG